MPGKTTRLQHVLNRYVDGELPPGDRLELEAFLARHPAVARRVAAYRRLNEQLHAAYDGYLDDPPSCEIRELRLRLEQRLVPRTAGRPSRLRRLGIAAGFACLGMAGGVVVANHPQLPTLGGRFVEAAVRWVEQTRWPALADRLGGPVAAADMRSGRAVHGVGHAAPNLAGFGFRLVTSRMIPAGPHLQAVQMIYESANDRRLLLYLMPRAGKGRGRTKISLTQEGPISFLSWSDGDRAYSMIAENLDRDVMFALAKAVTRDLAAKAPSPDAEPADSTVPRRGGPWKKQDGDKPDGSPTGDSA